MVAVLLSLVLGVVVVERAAKVIKEYKNTKTNRLLLVYIRSMHLGHTSGSLKVPSVEQ